MRLIPTIFASTQFVSHHGILVNGDLISLASYRINIGDVVSIPENQ
jgi:small subunit ribosomal protein S4